MQTEQSMHGVTLCSQNAHIEEISGKKTSGFTGSQKNSQKMIENKKKDSSKSVRDSGTQAEDLGSVQVTCEIDQWVRVEGGLEKDLVGVTGSRRLSSRRH